MAAKPGGSMLNTAVSLGRSGIHVEFISEIANDEAGDLIVNFLKENHVGTTFLNRYPDGKTTIALAFLNKQADATYSFYSDLPKERLTGKFPVPGKDDIILFGSFFSLTDGIFDKLASFLNAAQQRHTLILYDPNFRPPHSDELQRVMSRILKNLSLADVIRGSDEDFLHIFAVGEAEGAFNRIRTRSDQVLIYTKSDEAVRIITANQMITVTVPEITPVSTIGAGDSFNAGLIHSFITMGIGWEELTLLTLNDWERITRNAIRFAQNVCMSLENYISNDFIISLEK